MERRHRGEVLHQAAADALPLGGVDEVDGVELGVEVLNWLSHGAAPDEPAYLPIEDRHGHVVLCMAEPPFPIFDPLVDVEGV